jgi:small subunit ribosomal protein S3
MKQHCEAAMNAGAKGVKIICAGRLAGSEMARRETQKLGSIPLHTLDANVDYAVATSRTTYGTIGVKVWIYKGKFGEETERSARRRPRPPRRTGPVQKRGRLKVTPVESDKITTEAEKIAPAPPTESGGGEQTSTEGNGLGVDSG